MFMSQSPLMSRSGTGCLQQISKGLHVVILSSGIFFSDASLYVPRCLPNRSSARSLSASLTSCSKTVLAKALDLDGLDCS